jgi:hypothetical protein
MGFSDWIELLVVLYTNVCMPLSAAIFGRNVMGEDMDAQPLPQQAR